MLLPAGLAVVYALLMLALAGLNRTQTGIAMRRGLMLTLGVALVGAAIYALPADAHTDERYADLFVGDLTQPILGIFVINLMLVLFGQQALRYLQYRAAAAWTVLGLIWWIVQAAATLFEADSGIGEEG
jgi:hypothetical protein